MKLLITVVFLIAVMLLAVFGAVPPPPNVQFYWQYSGTNAVFKLYGTTNLSQPVGQWPTLATWTNSTAGGTNGSTVWYTNQIFLSPSAYFFTMTASNFWGEAPKSATVSVEYPSQTPSNTALIYIGP